MTAFKTTQTPITPHSPINPHRTASTIATETPNPVATPMYAATHAGHFGITTHNAPGTRTPSAFTTRRANRGVVASLNEDLQQHELTSALPPCSTRSFPTEYTAPSAPQYPRARTDRDAAPSPSD